MRVCELRGAFGLENLVSAERPTPEPGAREVLVRIEAASLNYRDLLTARAGLGSRPLGRHQVLESEGTA